MKRRQHSPCVLIGKTEQKGGGKAKFEDETTGSDGTDKQLAQINVKLMQWSQIKLQPYDFSGL